MENITKEKEFARNKRRRRIRKNVHGTPERPRLAVFRSLTHIYAQLIDDTNHTSFFSVSDLTPEIKEKIVKGTKKVDKSALVGQYLAEKAISKKITKVVFDRGGYKYHGRVKALADAARKAGLEF